MSGVHSIFESFEPLAPNVASLLKPDGMALLFGMFNPLPYDVVIKVRKAGSEGEFESGWNSFSRETVGVAFAKLGYQVEFIPWDVPLDIAQNADDGLRSWTTPMADGKRMVTNATRIIHDFYCAVITRQ